VTYTISILIYIIAKYKIVISVMPLTLAAVCHEEVEKDQDAYT